MIHLEHGTHIYYMDIQSGKISVDPLEEGGHFIIEANDSEYEELKTIANELYANDMKTYVRSHIPFLEYHFDKENDLYDQTLIKLYQKLYELGNEETKHHIKSMNILGKKELNEYH